MVSCRHLFDQKNENSKCGSYEWAVMKRWLLLVKYQFFGNRIKHTFPPGFDFPAEWKPIKWERAEVAELIWFTASLMLSCADQVAYDGSFLNVFKPLKDGGPSFPYNGHKDCRPSSASWQVWKSGIEAKGSLQPCRVEKENGQSMFEILPSVVSVKCLLETAAPAGLLLSTNTSQWSFWYKCIFQVTLK